MSERPDPAQLAEAVKGLSDDELAAQLRTYGYDEVLTTIFVGMRDAFAPEKAAGVTASIQYDIKAGDDIKTYHVVIADGACTVGPGPADAARLTLTLDIVPFVRLVFNQVQGPQLFMTGKLKLTGDMMFAMQMQNFFERRF